MYTSLVYVALAGVFANASAADQPLLHKSYSLARMQSLSVNKPVAVFIGSGERGWEEISQDGKFPADVWKLLSAEYVCVYVDMTRDAGKELAGAFEINEGPGLVVSNRQGTVQAFRHEGSLSHEDLERYLKRFADPNLVVQNTETTAQPRYSNYYQPVQQYPVRYNYAPVFSGGRGGC